MNATTSPESMVSGFDRTRVAFVEQLEAAPPESLSYLKPGDDYALGGLVHHVNAVLEHYLGVLDAMVGGRFGETEAKDRPGLFEEANARAKAGVTAPELAAALAETDRLHGEVRTRLTSISTTDFERKAPVRYEPGADPHPTSAADVAGWLTGHYEEHVPHIRQLLDSWAASR